MSESLFTIRVDTREQDALSFREFPVDEVVGTVKVFDYCIEGDTEFAVERKSLADFIGSLSSKRSWQRELNKIRKARDLGFRTIQYVVESSFEDLQNEETYKFSSKVRPGFIMKRWRELTFREAVNVTFATNKQESARAVFLLLKSRQEEIKHGTGRSC